MAVSLNPLLRMPAALAALCGGLALSAAALAPAGCASEGAARGDAPPKPAAATTASAQTPGGGEQRPEIIRLELAQTIAIRGELTDNDQPLDDDSPFDEYRVLAPAGVVSIALRSLNFDSFLIAVAGDVAVRDDDGAGALHARLEFRLDEAATLAVVANTRLPEGRGAYELLISAPRPAPRPAMPPAALAETLDLESRLGALQRLLPGDGAAAEEAIGLAARLAAIREQHQGADWWQTRDARLRAGTLRRLATLTPEESAALAEAEALNREVVAAHARGAAHEAIDPAARALAIRRRVLGEAHPQTLGSINNMGFVLKSQGRLGEAEPYYREALEGSRRVLGEAHPQTLTSINNMGALLESQGKLGEAEPYYREALEVRRRVLGEAHPDTLTSINNMGFLLKSQGKLGEAEPYYREALEAHRRVLGDEHPRTLTSISNLGVLLESQGRLGEAEPYFREVLEAHRRVLGDEHPSTLTSISNLGVLLESQGKLGEAEPYYREALEGSRRVLGEAHPDTLISIDNMGFLLESQGKLGEAEPYYREALGLAETMRTEIGGGARERADFAGKLGLSQIGARLAALLIETGRPAEALEVVQRSRSRAALDLLTAQADPAVAVRATGDAQRIARHERAVEAERAALVELRQAEARVSALWKQKRAMQEAAHLEPEDRAARLASLEEEHAEALEQAKARRHVLSEKTAAVLAELRGLIPAGQPLSSEKIVESLAPGELLLEFAWMGDRAIVLALSPDGVEGRVLAEDDESEDRLRLRAAGLAAALASRRGAIEERAEALASGAPIEGVDSPLWGQPAAALLPEALRARIGSASRVVVIPDGPLHALPMEIVLPETPIAYAPSATVYVQRRKAAASNAMAAGPPVIVGDPIFDRAAAEKKAEAAEGGDESEPASLAAATGEGDKAEAKDPKAGRGALVGLFARPSIELATRAPEEYAAAASALEQIRLHGGRLKRLPGTRREAEAIADVFSVKPLLEEAATAPRVWAAVEKAAPRVLHLATHGLPGNTQRPYQASLALTLPETPSPDDIGFLTLSEILARWRGRLEGCDLVVLSACDTGRGVERGDSVMSLPLGFFTAGAETVVASLWQVADDATALLMTRFYRNLRGDVEERREIDGRVYQRGEEMPKLDALREAQQWLRALSWDEADEARAKLPPSRSVSREVVPLEFRNDKPYGHPYYWAAFVLYGDPEGSL